MSDTSRSAGIFVLSRTDDCKKHGLDIEVLIYRHPDPQTGRVLPPISLLLTAGEARSFAAELDKQVDKLMNEGSQPITRAQDECG